MNILSIVVAVILILFCIDGAKKGLIKGIISIVSTILGIGVIYVIAKGIGNYVQKNYLDVIVALILLVVIRIINRIFNLISDSLELVTKIPVASGLNKVFGFFAGIIYGICFIWILFIVFGYFNFLNLNDWIKTQVAQNIFLSLIYKTNLFVDLLLMFQ